MLAYALLFVIPAIGLFSTGKYSVGVRNAGLASSATLLTLVIGLRYQVGADWDAYFQHFEDALGSDLVEYMLSNDPGYALVNWLAANAGFDIYVVNLFCGAIFTLGLIKFSSVQPYPWLSVAVALPYLLIVVAMNYSRQGAALGFLMFAYYYAFKGNFVRVFFFICFAALFHKSAAFMIFIVPFIYGFESIGTSYKIISSTLAFIVLTITAFSQVVNTYIYTYITSDSYHSDGSLIRVLMTAIPGCVMLIFFKRFNTYPDAKMWFVLAFVSVLLVPLAIYFPTATDRFALYIAPLQSVFACRFVATLPSVPRALFALFIFTGSFLLFYIWMSVSSFAEFWLPYKAYFLNG